ncbi:hypothetical protein KC19_VG194500 [Ceratodon purpureus]|uniref:Uncharacterized protein n=1 Tax=Ceratodon purpureus TaxID=3225 RepID=A0A8T0HRR9_CERPU|nr:hypothetical protein KC19_VG194500 [Ceratodon purpureus]
MRYFLCQYVFCVPMRTKWIQLPLSSINSLPSRQATFLSHSATVPRQYEIGNPSVMGTPVVTPDSSVLPSFLKPVVPLQSRGYLPLSNFSVKISGTTVLIP